MKTDDFDFELPQQLIAQTPLIDRPSSRLMVLDKTKQTYTDKHFYQIVDYLKAGSPISVGISRCSIAVEKTICVWVFP